MNYMPEVAKILGVKVGEEFNILNNETEMLVHGPYKFTDNALVDYVGRKTKDLLYGLLTREYTLQKRPWRPKDGGWFYHIYGNGGGVTAKFFNFNNVYDLALLNMGNCFPTKEAAEAAVPEMLAKFEEIRRR